MNTRSICRRIYRRQPVLCAVSSAHAACLLALLVAALIAAWRKPREELITVQLIDFSELADSLQSPSPERAVEPPSPTPEPPTPRPSEPPSQSPPVESVQPTTPAWQPRRPEDIRQQGLRPTTRRAEPTRQSPANPAPSAREIASRTRQQVSSQNMAIDIPSPAAGQPTVSPAAATRYLNAVIALLTREWNQPSATAVPADQRQATVTLVIGGDGVIRQARLHRPSRNPLMNRSVLDIFRTLKQLPPPRNYQIPNDPFEINVTFELD